MELNQEKEKDMAMIQAELDYEEMRNDTMIDLTNLQVFLSIIFLSTQIVFIVCIINEFILNGKKGLMKGTSKTSSPT